MWLEGLALSLYLALLPPVSILAADLVAFSFIGGPARYVEAKVMLEAGVEEIEALRRLGDKRAQRRIAKRRAELQEYRRIVARLQLVRLGLVLVFYIGLALLALRRYIYALLPVKPCIPIIGGRVDGVCVVPAAVVLLLSYLACLPLLEEPLAALSLYRRLLRGE